MPLRSRLATLASRREELVARSQAHRDEIRQSAASIRGQLSWAEMLLRATQALRRSGPVIAGVVGMVMVLGPARIVRLVATASRFAPVALDAYRFARRGGGGRTDEPRS